MRAVIVFIVVLAIVAVVVSIDKFVPKKNQTIIVNLKKIIIDNGVTYVSDPKNFGNYFSKYGTIYIENKTKGVVKDVMVSVITAKNHRYYFHNPIGDDVYNTLIANGDDIDGAKMNAASLIVKLGGRYRGLTNQGCTYTGQKIGDTTYFISGKVFH